MKARLNYAKAAPGVYAAMEALDQYLGKCGLDESLLNLVRLRASQINGCAYCLDMHWKDLHAIGEKEQRLCSLDAWRECPYYSERERAALAWTEAVTQITNGHAPEAIYEEVRPHFSEKELSDLTLAVATINAWNR
jgi:AhpD family alkylhydroperoxidase